MEAYQKLFEVAQRFLKRRATISELRWRFGNAKKKLPWRQVWKIEIMRLWFQFLNRTSCISKLRRLLSA